MALWRLGLKLCGGTESGARDEVRSVIGAQLGAISRKSREIGLGSIPAVSSSLTARGRRRAPHCGSLRQRKGKRGPGVSGPEREGVSARGGGGGRGGTQGRHEGAGPVLLLFVRWLGLLLFSFFYFKTIFKRGFEFLYSSNKAHSTKIKL